MYAALGVVLLSIVYLFLTTSVLKMEEGNDEMKELAL